MSVNQQNWRKSKGFSNATSMLYKKMRPPERLRIKSVLIYKMTAGVKKRIAV